MTVQRMDGKTTWDSIPGQKLGALDYHPGGEVSASRTVFGVLKGQAIDIGS